MRSAMTPDAVALIAATVFIWGALSGRLQRADLTAPIVFVAVGVVLHALSLLEPGIEAGSIKLLTEVTLAWVLFSDAAGVGVGELRADAGGFARLLGGALPLTGLLGWLVAGGLGPGFGGWVAPFVRAPLS